MADHERGPILQDIWTSFRALPLWVQIWMSVVLVPVNMASFAYLDQPLGVWICVLAVGGMAPNLPLIVYERGFSRLLSLPHLPMWTALVCVVLFARPDGSASYGIYLTVLLATNVISLLFDYADAYTWWTARA